MTIEIGFTDELTNTRFAPLALLSAHYQQNHVLEPLNWTQIDMRNGEFTSVDKLNQVLLSIMAGCETLAEANSRLKAEVQLAAVWGWSHMADQSGLSRMLDKLTLKNIEQLRQAGTTIWSTYSQARQHDWRSYLWLDFDLSGLPCGPHAEESQKGYFSEKKTSLDGSWRV